MYTEWDPSDIGSDDLPRESISYDSDQLYAPPMHGSFQDEYDPADIVLSPRPEDSSVSEALFVDIASDNHEILFILYKGKSLCHPIKWLMSSIQYQITNQDHTNTTMILIS